MLNFYENLIFYQHFNFLMDYNFPHLNLIIIFAVEICRAKEFDQFYLIIKISVQNLVIHNNLITPFFKARNNVLFPTSFLENYTEPNSCRINEIFSRAQWSSKNSRNNSLKCPSILRESVAEAKKALWTRLFSGPRKGPGEKRRPAFRHHSISRPPLGCLFIQMTPVIGLLGGRQTIAGEKNIPASKTVFQWRLARRQTKLSRFVRARRVLSGKKRIVTAPEGGKK